MASRKVEYANYLQSSQWRELRKQARERAGNQCEMCGGNADAVHHVRYPKSFKRDHVDNLIVVCDYHHKQLHGIRGKLMSEKFEVIAIQTAQQSMLSFTDETGVRWVSLPDVIAALLDVDSVKTAGLQRMQTQMLQNIEYELRQQGNRECQYKEWLERGQPVTVCFVNARGANRATMKTEGPRASALRTELLDKLEASASQSLTKTGDHITDLALSIVETRRQQMEHEERINGLDERLDSLSHQLRNEITAAAFLKEKQEKNITASRLGKEATKRGYALRKVPAPVGCKYPEENIYDRNGLERIYREWTH